MLDCLYLQLIYPYRRFKDLINTATNVTNTSTNFSVGISVEAQEDSEEDKKLQFKYTATLARMRERDFINRNQRMSTAGNNARILSCTGSMAGSWIYNIRKDDHSMMDGPTFRFCCSFRLGLPQNNLPHSCTSRCNGLIDHQGLHLFSWSYFTSHLTNRHDAILRDLKALAHSAGVEARTNKLQVFRQINPDDNRKPDLFLKGMGPSGEDLLVDLTIGHPSLPTYSRHASTQKRSTCMVMAEKKILKYRDSCQQIGQWFEPLCFEAFGSTTDKVMKLIDTLVSKAVLISGCEFSMLYNYWNEEEDFNHPAEGNRQVHSSRVPIYSNIQTS